MITCKSAFIFDVKWIYRVHVANVSISTGIPHYAQLVFFLGFFLQSLKLIQKIGKTATEVKHFAGKSLHFTHFSLNNATNSTTAETKLLFILKLTNTYDARKSEQAHIPHAPPLLENTVCTTNGNSKH